MQYNLLMFYKVLSNFATNFIGAFVPLIVFSSTGNMALGILCIVGENACEVIFNCILRKYLVKKPQLFLLLRIIPLLLFEFCLMMVASFPTVSIVFLILFQGLQYTFKTLPSEIVLNFATLNEKNTNKFAFSRFFEQIGYIAAGIVGGVLLEKLDHNLVISLSMILYVLSCLPLFIFYLKFRKQKNFNVENTTNAHVEVMKSKEKNFGKQMENKIKYAYIFQYVFIYLLNSLYTVFNLVLYTKTSNFIYSGIAISLFDTFYAIAVVLVTKLDEKCDLTIATSIITVLCGIIYPIVIYFAGSILSYVLFEIFAVLYAFPLLFINNRMVIKTRILGISSDTQFLQVNTLTSVTSLGFGLCILIGFFPFALVSGILSVFGGILVPITEEKTRSSLVKYLERDKN